MDNETNRPTVSIMDGYSDATHIFGICHIRMDGLDRFGRTSGAADQFGNRSIHREGMTKAQAVEWITSLIEDGGSADGFRIVAIRRPVWETVEAGPRNSFTPMLPLDMETES